MTIRVLIVDDQAATRLGLSLQLRRQDDIEIVGEASDGAEAIERVDALVAAGCAPDVVLMDVRMPGMNGIDATRVITGRFPGVRVLVLTTFDQDAYAFGALRAGASGFLLKDAATSDLVSGIQAVASGDAVLAPRITAELIRRTDMSDDAASHTAVRDDGQRDAASLVERLTPRERDILSAIGRGLSNGEIADEFCLAPSSVKTYVARLLTKLDKRDRVQLVILAYESGLNDR